jgi:16S rRNA C1402 N4-methylase RsmH
MEEWLLMQGFYHGLNQKTCEHLDATAEGSFLSLTLGKAKELMEKISDNQSWSQDKGEEAIEEVNALSTKMDELLHWLDQRAKYKEELHRTFYLLN